MHQMADLICPTLILLRHEFVPKSVADFPKRVGEIAPFSLHKRIFASGTEMDIEIR